MTGREQYEFGEFTLDVSERQLLKGADSVSLAPKAHDLLVALVRDAGRLITKRDLLELLWPDSFVEEGILSVHISSLRKALGDTSRRSTFIETVSRSGYRFIGSVTTVASIRHDAGAHRSLAVLSVPPPGVGMTEDEQAIGQTIADTLIDRFGRVEQLVVR